MTNDRHELFNLYGRNKASLGLLTRQKLENITKKKLLSDQKYAEAIGNKLVVFKGRAGTGKTIKLLHIACDLCVHHGRRVLVLTYNNLLVSDLERTLALAGISSDLDTFSISVHTIYKFVRDLVKHFGIEFDSERFVEDAEYSRVKATLLEYIKTGTLAQEDITSFKKQYEREVGWDSVLVDEGQDWPPDEREILFALFGSANVVVACGTGQLVRGAQGIDWTIGVDYHKPITGEKRTWRQKRNLCDFEGTYAEEFGVNWDLEPNIDLPGGKVVIVKGDYDKSLHEELMSQCKLSGNGAYEYMFLVPPSLTNLDEELAAKNQKRSRRFSLSEQFGSWGIRLWDGVNRYQRTEYPVNVEEHRVVPYDSARGLEGWVVVCMHLDKFVEYKQDCPYIADEDSQMSLGLSTVDERIDRLVHQWVLIALTRAIDTTVITLANPNSDFSKRLLKVAEQCSDFVSIRDAAASAKREVKQQQPVAVKTPIPVERPVQEVSSSSEAPASLPHAAPATHAAPAAPVAPVAAAAPTLPPPDVDLLPTWLQHFFLQLMVPAPRTFRLRCSDNTFTLQYAPPRSAHPHLPQVLPDLVSDGSFQILKRSLAPSSVSALPREGEEVEYGLTEKGIGIAREVRKQLLDRKGKS